MFGAKLVVFDHHLVVISPIFCYGGTVAINHELATLPLIEGKSTRLLMTV